MRIKRHYLALGLGILIMALLPWVVIAQDAQPTITPTPIPVDDGSQDDSAAPSLEGVAPPPAVTEESVVSPAATQSVEADTTSIGNGVVPSSPVCPTLVEESFTATEFVCEGVGTGEACIGNGTVEAIFGAADTGAVFANTGDTIRLTSLEELSLRSTSTANGVWTVVNARIELNSTDGAIPVDVPLLMFGDVTLSDTGQIASGVAQNGTVIAGRGLNVRRTPGNDGVLIWQLDAGEQVLATGITSDRQWIRIQIPSRFSGIGWAYAPFIEVDGGSDSLPFVTASSPLPNLTPPEFGPMQSVELLTANNAPDCNAIDSGILLQSPSGLPDKVRILINNVEIQLNGTAHIQAQADGVMTINVLEGEASLIVSGATTIVSVGNRATVSLNSNLQPSGTVQVSSITLSDFLDLPTRLLPRQIMLGTASTTTSDAPAPTQATGFGTPAPTNTPEACTLTARDSVRNMRTGPSTDYAIARVLQPNESVTGIGQVNILGFVWYQTTEGGWVRFDSVEVSAPCTSLSVVAAPPPPEPTAIPTPDASSVGLNSSLLGDVACPDGRVTASASSDGSDISIAIGGTWTAQAATTVTFTTQGGQLRPEFGDYIQIVAEDGSIIARSSEGRQLQVTFAQTTVFVARFSAANGDLIVMEAVCNGAG
ncbi:MAG: SH3 domain-containing protein [Anaerolineae bacterium]|nr:SH3 domain-containing protein [Anaerolineae bacterium]MDQ7033888.1 SH3 domain-containing protein [Anaerolineae bacterium]